MRAFWSPKPTINSAFGEGGYKEASETRLFTWNFDIEWMFRYAVLYSLCSA
jgi:hypothetical protein